MTIILSLFEATIALYPADASGAPILASPVWLGACVESLVVRESWLKRETRPTGRRHPRRRPLAPQYEISMGRVWAVRNTDRAGFNATRQTYVLDVVWREEEDEQGWRRETFYGVTISERTRESKDFDAEDGAAYLERQVFDAESVVLDHGTGTIPVLSSTVAYVVRYQSAAEVLDLYSYSTGTELFTALASTTGRATLTYNPTDRSDRFEVSFAGAPAIVFLDAAGDMWATDFIQGVPTLGDLPRLDFYRNTQRMASISSAGKVFATTFEEGVPSGSGLYLYGGGSQKAILTLSKMVAAHFIETAAAGAILGEGGATIFGEGSEPILFG